MGLSLRTKLVIAAAAPLAVLTGLALSMGHHLETREAIKQTSERMQLVADLYAARFDGLFQLAGQIADHSATTLSTDPHIHEYELYELLRVLVADQPMVYGACIAFEPGGFKQGLDRFAPYVYRGPRIESADPRARTDPRSLLQKDVAKFYDYADGSWEWYSAVRADGKSRWTEPYFDKDGGEIVMTTYSAPITRDGEFVGVTTADVALGDLAERVDSTDLSSGNFAIISRGGKIVAAPNPGLVMRPLDELAGRNAGRAEVDEIGAQLVTGGRGVRRVRDFPNPGWNFVFFSPIPSTGWTFVASLDESVVMGPVYRELSTRAAFFIGLSALTLGIVWLATSRLTKPIEQLAGAVEQLGAGQIDMASIDIPAKDELGRLAHAFNRMVKDLRTHIAALTEETAARERIEADLRVAREIQASLLPREFPKGGYGAFDVFGVNVPARHVAGDFFDVFELDGPGSGRLLFVIADVSGKGMPAAMFMAVARTVLRQVAAAEPTNGEGGITPARIASAMNRILCTQNDNGMFVTMFLGVLDTRTGELTYTNAGHPKPYVTGAGGTRVFGEVTGTVLAAMTDAAVGEQRDILRAGERLVLYTDGVPEAAPMREVNGRTSVHGEFFGEARMAALFDAVAAEPLERACATIAERISAYQDGELRDDVTLLVVERKG